MSCYSSLAPATFEKFRVCSISLNMTDRIRLIGLPSEVVGPIREAILAAWGPIQAEKDYYGTHEFKLKGNPWLARGEDSVRSRRLLTELSIAMARNGWNILQAADVSKIQGDKDTLFFEYGIPDPDVQMFSMSFDMGDRIKIIDAPSFFPLVKDAVESQWSKGIQQEREIYGCMELKLAGSPWISIGSEAVYSKMVLCQVIANLRSLGYKLYMSVDINLRNEGGEIETFVFRKVNSVWQ